MTPETVIRVMIITATSTDILDRRDRAALMAVMTGSPCMMVTDGMSRPMMAMAASPGTGEAATTMMTDTLITTFMMTMMIMIIRTTEAGSQEAAGGSPRPVREEPRPQAEELRP